MENILDVKNRYEFRKWLEKNYLSEKECYVLLTKGKPQDDDKFYYLDGVEEALCFGWIDSTLTKINGVYYSRFSPRRKGSYFSELNKARIERLKKLGLMVKDYQFEKFRPDRQVLNDIKKAGVYETFLTFPPLYQRIRLYNLAFAKGQSNTNYQKALKYFIDHTHKGKLYGEWSDYGRLIEEDQIMNDVTLNNGVKIPSLGLGTYLLKPAEAEKAVTVALKNGYSLIDTANAYENEKAVGRGLKNSALSREKAFLETKLWPYFYEDENAIDNTLKRLNVDYIDLMILHQPAGNYIAGYKLLEKAYQEGKLKAIGISNFTIDEIKNLLAHTTIKPALIQVECHPYYPQDELKVFLKENNIALQAWYPLGGRGNDSLLTNPLINELANTYHKTPAQIILRWHIQQGNIVIPGSKDENHIKDNINIFDFELTDADLAKIATIKKSKPIFIRKLGMMTMFAHWKPNVDQE